MKPLFLLLAAVTADPAEDFNADSVDLVDALTCRLEAPAYNGFAMALASGGADAPDAKRGWRKLKTDNPYMIEYQLPAPITLAGHYATSHIGFTANGVVGFLDQPDPSVIAKPEGIANAMDPEPLIRSLTASGKVTRAQIEKEITFHKFMGQKVVVDSQTPPAPGESFGMHKRITHEISNVSTAPGKTLYGCSYQIEPTDKDGKPL
ncbi:hypothetical protein [Novosphingobium rosa]|uniref:hypothetical protein n=1 Tax=Novosphingobium rosa TaxID=76978 RepID=UPI00082D3B41|nr:hypothetical protein [Novosphingobium rosa]